MLKVSRALLAIVFAALGAMMFVGVSPAGAQDDAAPYDLTIMARLCEESPCSADTATPIGDITAFVTSEDGSVDYGSCTTSIEGNPDGCSVPVDAGTIVQVAVDESTLPEGYVAEENPVFYEVPAEKSTVDDVFLYFSVQAEDIPEEEVPEEETGDDVIEEDLGDGTPAAELPETGTGTGSSSTNETSPTTLIVLGGGASLVVIAAVALVLNRRSLNS